MVEHPSFDDFYVLLEGHSLDEAASWAKGVRASIVSETGLRCSAGVARTKLMSLLATKKGKPNGQWLCRAHSEERTLLDDVRADAMRGAEDRVRSELGYTIKLTEKPLSWLGMSYSQAPGQSGDDQVQEALNEMAETEVQWDEEMEG